ncbi:MAG TPA: ATP-binding protein [Thermoanaerobaculia bacterium]|jgi:signal transduction histidine kinase|nr:ATP-binding protein [Thermoanaerobaculia bacterium]
MFATAEPARGRRLAASALPILLLLLLGAVNALAIAGVVSARRSAREAALQDLRLQTEGHARALEAVLGGLRRDLLALARGAALHQLLVEGGGELQAADAARAEAERALLAFAQSHAAIRAAALRDNSGAPLVLVGRRDGAPVLLPGTSDPPAPIADRDLLVAQLPVAGRIRERGLLEVWVDRRLLLDAAAPALGDRLELRAAGDESAATPPGRRLVASASVRDPLWSPPVAWTLVRDEPESRILESVAELAGRYRRTALLNLAVMALTLLLGFLAFQQAQRSSALQAENRQQARLRELERQILHAERLASVGRLAAGVAHEVNNPLEGVFNYLSLLEEDVAAGDVERSRRGVARIREGLSRVAAVMRQMLSLSDPGRVEKAPLDLREPISRAAEFVGSHRAAREVPIRLDLPAQPVRVEGNAVTLGQLFLNLLLNAAQIQDGRGEVEVSCRDEGGRAVVRVADRGPGFTPDAQAHLFEPFFSTRGSIGLGLAVCAGIVRDHGGSIRAVNRDGGGAELVVELPLIAAGDRTAATVEKQEVEAR